MAMARMRPSSASTKGTRRAILSLSAACMAHLLILRSTLTRMGGPEGGAVGPPPPGSGTHPPPRNRNRSRRTRRPPPAASGAKNEGELARLMRRYDEVASGVAYDPGAFVKPVHTTLTAFHEARTPIVVEQYKLVLFPNPKSGSTVLKQLMRRMTGHSNYRVSEWGGKDALPHRWPANGLNYTSHYSLREINEMMTSDEWTRATFVRDPKGRALSAYLMLRPRMEMEPELLERARRGEVNGSIWRRWQMMRWPQLPNCCRTRTMQGVDTNWKLLCCNHTLTFEGFLDMIENGRSRFDDALREWTKPPSPRIEGGFSPESLRTAPGCHDIHWSPLSHWRLEPKFWKAIDFVGHLETAQRDVRRLLDRLHPRAWERYGASGWGRHGNESMFGSSSTVSHANNAEEHLGRYYASDRVERRVEAIYKDDYDNEYLDLERVAAGRAREHYRNRPPGRS